MKQDLELDTLEERRESLRLILMYKVVEGLVAHSPVKCEIPKNTRPRHLKIFRTQYIFVSNCF